MPSPKASQSWSFGLCSTHSCSIFPVSGIGQFHDILPAARVLLLRQSLESTPLENPLKTDLPCLSNSDRLPTTLVTAHRLTQRSGPPASIWKGQEPVASVEFFFFLSRLSFSNTLLLKHNWKNPKLLIYKASPHTATNSHRLYLLSWTWSNFSENIKIIFFIFNLENWMFFNIHHHNLTNFKKWTTFSAPRNITGTVNK